MTRASQKEWVSMGIILLIGFSIAVVLGLINGGIILRDFSQDAGLTAYHETASSLLHTLSFHNEKELFFETIRRPPGYPIFLAFSYLLFGERLMTVWIMQMALLLASIFLLWRISRCFFDGWVALLPPFFLALWWGMASQVFVVNVEIFTLFLVIVAAWAWLRYEEERRLRWIILGGVAFGWLVLVKAAFLYFVLLAALGGMMKGWRLRHGAIALALTGIIIGSWSLYSYRLLGTFQLASGGLTVMRRADDVLLSSERIKQFMVASFFGDYIADRLFSGYAENPEPLNHMTLEREKEYAQRRLPDKSNETMLQKETIGEAMSLVKQAPLKFVATAIPYIIRLNRPVAPKGGEIDQLFLHTYAVLSYGQKIALLLTFLSAWYLFVAGVFFGIVQRIRKEGLISRWTLPLALIIYTNGIYALLSHAEARYLFPAMPFYFLFFSAFIASLFKTKALRVVPDSMIENQV